MFIANENNYVHLFFLNTIRDITGRFWVSLGEFFFFFPRREVVGRMGDNLVRSIIG